MVQRVARNPKPRPRFIEPMECKRVPKLPEGDTRVYEPKQDGYRIIAVIDANTTVLHSMSGLNYTAKYPHIAEALKWLKLREAVFDGEVVALDASGRPNFQELQAARLTKLPIVYFIFDLLHLKGRDLLDIPLSERRQQLEQLAKNFENPVRLNPSFQVPLADMTASVQALGLEGIVAKRSDSIYVPGKESDGWRKHRFNQEDEFVIGGYISGGQNFSELLIGEEQGDKLMFIKRLIAGFTPHTRAEIFEAIKGLRTPKCPFANLPERRKSPHALSEEIMRQCVWVKPEHRCEVEFVERTKGGRLRHAEFRRLVS